MKSESPSSIAALLALEDGRTFACRSFTGPGEASGEIVFNTGMTGYQEILSDPSYCGQMVTMTCPLIGNYGVNPEDMESDFFGTVPLTFDDWLFMAPFFFASPIGMELVKIYIRRRMARAKLAWKQA